MDIPNIEPIQPKLNVGDIVIFSTLLVHESGDILNDEIRWSASFRYGDALESEFIERGYPSKYQYIPITKQPPKDFKEVTGFNTPEELSAYEKGREHEGRVIVDWIKKWNGKTNSVMGQILYNKFKEIK